MDVCVVSPLNRLNCSWTTDRATRSREGFATPGAQVAGCIKKVETAGPVWRADKTHDIFAVGGRYST